MLIADACSAKLGTCCSNWGLVSIISVLKNILDIIQLIVPILLIIFLTIQLTKMVVNPDEKKNMSRIKNQLLATVIVFAIPVIINVLLNIMPQNFELTACWNAAKHSKEIMKSSSNKYKSIYDTGKNSMFNNRDDYDKGEKRQEIAASTPGNGSATGQEIVAYAQQFLGGTYSWGGSWNGEHPYHNTDCSGFVGGVYKHFGYKMPRSTRDMQTYFPAHFKRVSENEVQAGDVVLYYGHVGLATGNGYEMIHNTRPHIKMAKDFRYRSISGIYRIVN